MTSAVKVKRALVEALTNRPEFHNRQVAFGHPGSEMESECCFIVAVRGTETARMMGKAHRREELTVELGILSEVLGSDLVDCEERAWEMFAGVEEALAEDSSLGGRVLIAEVSSFEQKSFRGEQKEACEITVELRIVADKDGEV